MEIAARNERSISERLTSATEELHKLQQLVLAEDCSPRVLSDFRGAVDGIRQTAWAVQQWHELKQQHRDPYSVLGILTEERVRRATQITHDLTMDMDSLELGLETEGLEKLFLSVRGLYERLLPLFRRRLI